MHPRFAAPLTTLSAELRQAILPLLSASDFSGMISAQQAESLKQACNLSDSELAFALLPLAAACAVTPISHFNVGAVARGVSGDLWFGQ